MEQFIGCDAHKKFSMFASIDEKGVYGPSVRVGHDRKVFRAHLQELPAGSQIALETSGCYYWIVDEMKQAGHHPRLAHALTAKRRMEGRHKTDALDARGLADRLLGTAVGSRPHRAAGVEPAIGIVPLEDSGQFAAEPGEAGTAARAAGGVDGAGGAGAVDRAGAGGLHLQHAVIVSRRVVLIVQRQRIDLTGHTAHNFRKAIALGDVEAVAFGVEPVEFIICLA